jgi:protein required for attachment to host cells
VSARSAALERSATARCCVIVADRTRARLFLVADSDGGTRRLVEQADLQEGGYAVESTDVPMVRSECTADRGAEAVHPPADRAHRRLALEQRFARALAVRTASLVDGWDEGQVMLVAPADVLGQLRELMRKTLAPHLTLRELAREYTQLSVSQLARQLGYSVRATQGRP